jgi:hypothetical protein
MSVTINKNSNPSWQSLVDSSGSECFCINQDDKAEKAHQVKLMAVIFQKGHQVLVWLGPDTDRSVYKAFQSASFASQLAVRDTKRGLPPNPFGAFGNCLKYFARLQALLWLLSTYGKSTISWDTLWYAFYYLGRKVTKEGLRTAI